jgi:hypothetical protein
MIEERAKVSIGCVDVPFTMVSISSELEPAQWISAFENPTVWGLEVSSFIVLYRVLIKATNMLSA